MKRKPHLSLVGSSVLGYEMVNRIPQLACLPQPRKKYRGVTLSALPASQWPTAAGCWPCVLTCELAPNLHMWAEKPPLDGQ